MRVFLAIVVLVFMGCSDRRACYKFCDCGCRGNMRPNTGICKCVNHIQGGICKCRDCKHCAKE